MNHLSVPAPNARTRGMRERAAAFDPATLAARSVALFFVALFSTASAFAAPLISTNPTWQIEGDQASSLFGVSAVTAGDINGDGFSDLIVGAPFYDNGHSTEGQVRVYLGSAAGVSSVPFRTYESDEAGALMGNSVACLGDATGDGFDDIAVGAPSYGASDIGAVFVYKGSASGPPSGGANRTLLGDNDSGFGGSISAAGDVNGDGFQDLLIGASLYSNGQTNEGRALIYLGAAGGVNTSPSWAIEPNATGIRFGTRVSGAGDVNGDGFDDVLVSAARFSNGESNEGKVFLYLGSASGPSTTPAWQVEGNQASSGFGNAIGNAGDVNGDGYADFLVGARGYDNGNTNEGRAYLFLGGPGTISTTPARTYEVNQDAAGLGASVGTAGDMNGDGYADFVVGGPGINAGGTARGRVLLFLGSSGSTPSSAAFLLNGTQDASAFGDCAVTAGDIDSDGFSDLVVGATTFDAAFADGGAVFLYRGAAAPPQTNPQWAPFGAHDGDRFGDAVTMIGDINADGFDDVAVSAPDAPVSNRRDGLVSIYRGSEIGLSAAPAITINSPTSGESGSGFGTNLSRAGDWNADGFDDLLIGDYSDGGGKVQLIRGAAGTPLLAGVIVGEPTELLGCDLSSGDFDGDGFSDIVIAGQGYDDFDLLDVGRVRVFNGGPSGPDSFADWELRGKVANGIVGHAAANAGDVNGDGYDDLLVTRGFLDALPLRGVVELYLGSPCGPGSTPVWTRSGTSTQDYGFRLATCGDVNGDGFADVAIAAVRSNDGHVNGQVEIFHGNAEGLELTPALTLTGTTSELSFGRGVASAGDVNGDGYSDLIIGAPNFTTGLGGNAHLHLGSANGLGASAAWNNSPGGSTEDGYGVDVAGAGDVNADGYSDVIVGAPWGEVSEFNQTGFAAAYLGNEGVSVDRDLFQTANTASVHLATGARNPQSNELVRVEVLLRSACGRTRARHQLDRRSTGQAFGFPTHSDPVFTDTGAPVAGEGSAVLLGKTFSGFFAGQSFHWRLRVETVNPYFPHNPWLSPQGNSPAEADVRMLPITADVAPMLAAASLDLAPPAPNPMRESMTVRFILATSGSANLAIYDAQGRMVRELLDRTLEAGPQAAHWDGRDTRGALVPSGVYFARLNKGPSHATQKVVVRR